jgi:hypothetical protein
MKFPHASSLSIICIRSVNVLKHRDSLVWRDYNSYTKPHCTMFWESLHEITIKISVQSMHVIAD